MQEKSFATCFDKNYEEFAELLMSLVSENPSICNINQKKEVFKKDRAITSNEYVLTIGPDGSKVNRASFPDSYNKYGIHIGYRGRKAWISCEDFDWTEKSLREFRKEMIQLLKELGMKTDDINACIEQKKMIKTGLSSEKYIIAFILFTTLSVATAAAYLLMHPMLQWVVKMIHSGSKRRKQQYKMAVALFYHKYITDFLELKISADNNAEEEKMNF